MKNFKTDPISSTLGILILLFAGVLLFIPTLYDIPLLGIALIALSGIMLFGAKDNFISIVTLGLSRFVKGEKDGFKNNVRNEIGGDMPDPDKEEK